jgi:hypothetical protein
VEHIANNEVDDLSVQDGGLNDPAIADPINVPPAPIVPVQQEQLGRGQRT